jgi:hypothetical protein
MVVMIVCGPGIHTNNTRSLIGRFWWWSAGRGSRTGDGTDRGAASRSRSRTWRATTQSHRWSSSTHICSRGWRFFLGDFDRLPFGAFRIGSSLWGWRWLLWLLWYLCLCATRSRSGVLFVATTTVSIIFGTFLYRHESCSVR